MKEEWTTFGPKALKVLYVVIPNFVQSRTDREKHWISGAELVKLYHLTHYLHWWYVAPVHREDPPEVRQAKVEALTEGYDPGMIRLLEPRYDGAYQQPPGNRGG